MEDILQQHQAPELHAPAQQIQSTLFSHESGQDRDFDTRALIILVVGLRRQKLRQNKRNRRQQQYALPPLYKTS
jgi:hypothetical protein